MKRSRSSQLSPIFRKPVFRGIAAFSFLTVIVLCLTCRPALAVAPLDLPTRTRVALVGGSAAERMSLFGNFETMLHLRTTESPVVFRNFAWPADEVSVQQRPGNYTKIDDPMQVYAPEFFLCFFGANESFIGDSAEQTRQFIHDYIAYLDKMSSRFSRDSRNADFILVTPTAFESTGDPLQPSGEIENKRLQSYSHAIARVAEQRGLACVDLFTPTLKLFASEPANLTRSTAYISTRPATKPSRSRWTTHYSMARDRLSAKKASNRCGS